VGHDGPRAVAHQMALPAGFLVGLLNRRGQPVLDQQIRALRIPASLREVRLVTNAVDKGAELKKVEICQQKAGNDDYGGSVSPGYAETPIHGRQAQVNHLDRSEERRVGKEGR